MDEVDYIEYVCGVRPDFYFNPMLHDWKNNETFIPYEVNDSKTKIYPKLPGCYCYCAVDLKMVFPKDKNISDLATLMSLWDKADWLLKDVEFLYVGKAIRMRDRLTAHERDGLIDKVVEYCWEDNKLFMVAIWLSDERNALEKNLIDKLNPIFNITKNP